MSSLLLKGRSAVLHRICSSRKEEMGCYRFLNNSQVKLSSLISANCQPWIDRSLDLFLPEAHYLVVSDTSSLDWSRHSGQLKVNDPDLGPLEHKGLGFFVHPSLVLESESGFPLGLSDLYLWNRGFDQDDKRARNYKRQPYAEKESYKWTQALLSSADRLAACPSRFTYVMDREADIYDLFAQTKQGELLVRSAQNRLVVHQGKTSRLHELLDQLDPAAQFSLELPATHKRKARSAKMRLSFERIEILRPTGSDQQLAASMPISLVHVKESEQSVPEGESPIQWILWTSHQVGDLKKALAVVQWYRYRWVIEELFSLLKTRGVAIEESQLNSGIGLKKLTVMALQTALNILQLTKGREVDKPLKASLLFESGQINCLQQIKYSLEGKTVKQQNPHLTGSLAWAAWIIGRLGGWKGYTSQSPPGPKTMARGLRKFEQIFKGWTIANNLKNANKVM